MRLAILVPIILLAACGSGEETVAVEDKAASAEQIRRLSTPGAKDLPVDPEASARLQPLSPDDLAREGVNGSGCEFRSAGDLLLASTGSDSLVRINDTLLHLVHSAPVGPSGGFFEDRSISVSIGRKEGAVAANASTARQAYPARARVTNRRSSVQLDRDGIWACRA